MRDVYSDNAKNWWDKQGPFKMLHRMHPHRLACLLNHLPELSDAHVLDYACGGGLMAESLCRLGARVVGVDQSAEIIDAARSHALADKLAVTYIHGTIDSLDDVYFIDDPFDVVCALECLEHVQSPERMLASLSSCLKPGGYAVFSTINRTALSTLFGIFAAEYLLGWVEPGTHEYDKFIKPSELVRMGESSGLSLIDLQGISFDTKIQDFYLSDDVTINYITVFRKTVG